MRHGIAHLRALDGLRGLAVAGVVLFHANGLLKGGYLGVDLFFVLSGFLITSILLAEQEATQRIDLRMFWVRRARRLFPALLALMVAIAIYAWVVAMPDEQQALRGDALATLGYVANWRAIFSNKSYWDLFVAPSPLEHTWSLAIEEQFYVVWPLLVTLVLVVLHRTRRTLFAVTLVLAVASALAMLWVYDPEHTTRAYFGTDTRAIGILAGAALAMQLGPGAKLAAPVIKVLDVLGFVALALLGFAWARLDGQAPFLYRGGLWLTEIGGLVLLTCGTQESSKVARVLGWRPLARLGTISYGVYLWHWPIDCLFVPERIHLRGLLLDAVRIATTLVIALVSERWLERPIRQHGLRVRSPITVAVGSFFGVALLVAFATRSHGAAPLRLGFAQAARNANPHVGIFAVDTRTLPPAEKLPPGTLRVLVLGDSVSAKLGVALRFRQEEFHTFVAERGVGQCSILEALTISRFGTGETADPNTGCAGRWVGDVAELHPDVTFIVLGGGYFAKMSFDGKPATCCDRNWHDAYVTRLESLVDGMTPAGGRIFLALVPYPMDRWRYGDILDRVDCFNGILREVAASRSLQTVDIAGHVCPTRDCILFSGGAAIRPDGLHPDGKGAEETARFTLREITRLAQ